MEVNVKKHLRENTTRLNIELMDHLWHKGKLTAEAKLNDLKSLLQLLSEDARYFYKDLTRLATILLKMTSTVFLVKLILR